MKNHWVILICLISVLFTECKNGAKYKDVVIFTGTEQSPTITFNLDGPSGIGLSLTSSGQVNLLTTINLKIDAEKLTEYNQQSGANYQLPPENSFKLENEKVTITPGEYVSGGSELKVLSPESFKEGINYCIPISIVSIDGDLSWLDSSRTVYVIIKKTITTQVADLEESNYFTVESFKKSPDVSALSGFTMECRVYPRSFPQYFPYVGSIMGIEENFLLRFGVVSPDIVNPSNSQLQIQGGTVSGTKFPVTSSGFLTPNKWYHVAAVYNGSTVALYVNGKLEGFTSANKGTVNLNDDYFGGFHIGQSAGGRYLDGLVSEARVWSRALTREEMKNNMCYVDPTSKGLVAYWRFNGTDENGNVPDLTGHGHAATPARTVKWVEGIKCP